MAVPVQKPTDWEKAVAVAWCFVLGRLAKDAAAATGVSESTIRNWLKSPWWPEAYAEARAKVPIHLEQRSLGVISDGLDLRDLTTARWVAERVVPELAPPTVRTDHTSGGQQLPSTIQIVLVTPEKGDNDEGDDDE